MKRVVAKITATVSGSWSFTVNVDGEEFAKGVCRDYMGALDSAWAYARSIAGEAPETQETDRG